MSFNPSFFGVFCDDIRQETQGKLSIMGTYNTEMYVPSYPFTLPRLSAFFELRVPIDTGTTEVVIKMIKGSETMNEVRITLPEQFPGPKTSVTPMFKKLGGGLSFPQITIAEPTLLELVAEVDGKSLMGARLWVTLNESAGDFLSVESSNNAAAA